ncbi:MAG: hypothetical protein ACK50Q_01065 [Labrys sp. (in: a-proteobacteria)]
MAGNISKPHNALVERSRREDHGGPYQRKPVAVSEKEWDYEREWRRQLTITMFEKDDVTGLERYARAMHPDAVTISFDRVNRLIRILKPSGSWVTLA